MKENNIKVHQGFGKLADNSIIKAAGDKEEQEIVSKDIILATEVRARNLL